MNTQLQGIPSTARNSGDHLIPAPLAPIAPSLIERIAASHFEVLENWNQKFALDLRWRRPIQVVS